jgi:hypothetical protein
MCVKSIEKDEKRVIMKVTADARKYFSGPSMKKWE